MDGPCRKKGNPVDEPVGGGPAGEKIKGRFANRMESVVRRWFWKK